MGDPRHTLGLRSRGLRRRLAARGRAGRSCRAGRERRRAARSTSWRSTPTAVLVAVEVRARRHRADRLARPSRSTGAGWTGCGARWPRWRRPHRLTQACGSTSSPPSRSRARRTGGACDARRGSTRPDAQPPNRRSSTLIDAMYGRLTAIDPVPIRGRLALVVRGQDEVPVAVVPLEVMAPAGGRRRARCCAGRGCSTALPSIASPTHSPVAGSSCMTPTAPALADDALPPAGLLPGDGQREGGRHAERASPPRRSRAAPHRAPRPWRPSRPASWSRRRRQASVPARRRPGS